MIYYESHNFGNKEQIIITELANLDYRIQHFHRNYELLCLFSSSVDVHIDNEHIILNAGQFLLIHPNQEHALYSRGNARGRSVIFSPHFIETFYQKTKKQLPEKIILDFRPEVRDFIHNNLINGSDLYLIKSCLYAACSEIKMQTEYKEKKHKENFEIIHATLLFIENNFKNNIQLKDVAQHLNYDYKYISKYFNKNFNLTFTELLNNYRIDCAMNLIKNTDKTIIDIGLECGFNNIRSFNRNFKKIMGKTPRDCR